MNTIRRRYMSKVFFDWNWVLYTEISQFFKRFSNSEFESLTLGGDPIPVCNTPPPSFPSHVKGIYPPKWESFHNQPVTYAKKSLMEGLLSMKDLEIEKALFYL